MTKLGEGFGRVMYVAGRSRARAVTLVPRSSLYERYAYWSSRSGNAEADALANGDIRGFDPSLRRIVDPTDIVWEVCTCSRWDVQPSSITAEANGHLLDRGVRQSMRKPEECMRAADPR